MRRSPPLPQTSENALLARILETVCAEDVEESGCFSSNQGGEKMNIAARLQHLREWKNLSQGDIEKSSGLLRCYISRVECGHTVPSIETLQKISSALSLPLYQLFLGDDNDGQEELTTKQRREWASIGMGKSDFRKLRSALARMSAEDRTLLMLAARKMISRR